MQRREVLQARSRRDRARPVDVDRVGVQARGSVELVF